jgi:hypothetical protein
MAGISGAKANLLQLVLALSGSDIRAWCAVWSETIRYAQGDSMPSRHSERSEESQRRCGQDGRSLSVAVNPPQYR